MKHQRSTQAYELTGADLTGAVADEDLAQRTIRGPWRRPTKRLVLRLQSTAI